MRIPTAVLALASLSIPTGVQAREFTSEGWYIVYDGKGAKADEPAAQGRFDTLAACTAVLDGPPAGAKETPRQLALRLARAFNEMKCVELKAPLPADK